MTARPRRAIHEQCQETGCKTCRRRRRREAVALQSGIVQVGDLAPEREPLEGGEWSNVT